MTARRPDESALSDRESRTALTVALLGALVLSLVLVWPKSGIPWPYQGPLESAANALKGRSFPSDLAADIIGFRAMVRRENPYPVLGSAARSLGLRWPVPHVSTHPPTACLLSAPVAFLPWPVAAMIWAWLMLGLLAAAFRLYGLRWPVALGLTPIALLWPPVSTSLGQLTIIWLFGFAVGYRYRHRRPFLAGIGIGLAALTKMIPGLMIVLFASKRRWRAVLGMTLVGVVSLACAVWLSPDSLALYVDANRANSGALILRKDNASLLGTGYRSFGAWGIVLVLAFLAVVVWANRRSLQGNELFPSTTLWMLSTYVVVALLPLSWIYSLAPLLPVVVYLLARGKLPTLCVGLACVAIPFLVPIWGVKSVGPLVLVNVLVGVGLVLDALPFPPSMTRSSRNGVSGPPEAPALRD